MCRACVSSAACTTGHHWISCTPSTPSTLTTPLTHLPAAACCCAELEKHLGQADLEALLRGHPLTPRREQGLRRVLAQYLPVGAYEALDRSALVDALVRRVCSGRRSGLWQSLGRHMRWHRGLAPPAGTTGSEQDATHER
jgi:hypothetical protein